jgi:hypothetical protein
MRKIITLLKKLVSFLTWMADRAESPERFPMRSSRRLFLKPTFPAKIDNVIDKLKKDSFHIYALHFFKKYQFNFYYIWGRGTNSQLTLISF